jgi:hypothetical protein
MSKQASICSVSGCRFLRRLILPGNWGGFYFLLVELTPFLHSFRRWASRLRLSRTACSEIPNRENDYNDNNCYRYKHPKSLRYHRMSHPPQIKVHTIIARTKPQGGTLSVRKRVGLPHANPEFDSTDTTLNARQRTKVDCPASGE